MNDALLKLFLRCAPRTRGFSGHAVYDLDGTVHHSGEGNDGHYIAYARIEGSKWLCFDNNKATTAFKSDALSNEACIISYTLRR